MDEQPEKSPRPIVSEDLSASANRVDPLVAEMTQEIREPASEITPVSNGIYIPSSEPDRLRNDRSARYSEQNYTELVGDPYQCAIVVDAQTQLDHAVDAASKLCGLIEVETGCKERCVEKQPDQVLDGLI